MLVAVGVFVASLLLSGGAAEAHGKHSLSIETVATQSQAEHVESGHQGHCHGGAFCGGPAIIQQSLPGPILLEQRERFGILHHTEAVPIALSFEPPPPRTMI